jgi:type II secretory pathway pseudopilin PulG
MLRRASVSHRSAGSDSGAGFTIVEVTIALTIIGILIIPVSMILLQFYGQTVANSRETQLAIDSHNTLTVLTEDLRTSSGIKSSAIINDENAPSDGWETSSTDKTLVVSTPSLNNSRQMIINPSTGKPYKDEIIYYVAGSELRKRYLANPGVGANRATTTCPPDEATSGCPADTTLSQNLKNFSFTFFDASNTTTTVPSNTRSIKVSTEMFVKVYGRDISYNDTTQIAIRNSL